MKRSIRIGEHSISLWIIVVLLISIISMGVLADYLWKTIFLSVEIKEPLEIVSYPSMLSLYPGETEEFNITIMNHASRNYTMILDFSLDNVTYQESYVTFSDELYNIIPGQQDLTSWLKVETHAPPINASLTIDFRRIEKPFSDEFNTATLDPRWTVVDPYGGSALDLNVKSGYLTISTTSPPDKDLFGGVNFYAPRIMQSAEGDITIETKVWAVTNANVQSAGIVLWKDENNFLRLERAQRYDYQEILFIGTIAGIWSISSGENSDPGAILHIPNVNPTYLRMVRTGNVYYGYYSDDGTSWNFIASITMDVNDPIQVGLYVVNRIYYGSPSFTASFDYFRIGR